MSNEIEWTPVKVKLGDLSHWADNPVTLSKAQAKKLLRSKEKLGKMQTLAIGPSNGDGKYPLYDGHQRANVWGAAFGMGLEVWALQSSRPLTDEERHAVPIMLRTAVGSLDWDVLAGWTDYPVSEWGLDDDALQGLKFDIAALVNLLESETPEPADAEPQIDRAEELNEKWQVKTGDLWRIGEHRLLCGDSTRREDVERVMDGEKVDLAVTSPPYNQGIDKFHPSGMHKEGHWVSKVEQLAYADSLPEDEYQDQQRDALGVWFDVMRDCASFFYNHKNRYRGKCVVSPLEWLPGKFKLRQEIIWSRPGSVTQNARMFLPSDERIYWLYKGDDFYFDDRTDIKSFSTVWDIALETNKTHAVAFPIGIPVRCIMACSKSRDIVFEPYCGSGTTIVACQNLDRKCRAIEISPAYCAVTLERMATAFPGIEIARIE